MTEKRRTASEIRAYCEQLPRLLRDVPKGVSNIEAYRSGVYMGFTEQARIDLPCLLDAVMGLRYELVLLRDAANDMGCFGYGKRVADALDETAWLAEGEVKRE